MSNARYEFKPNWLHLIPPGDTILESMESMGMSQVDLAKRTEYSTKHIHKLLKGEAPINADTALRLEKVLNMPAYFWMNLENAYRGALAKEIEKKSLAQKQSWLNDIPLKSMLKFGWIKKYPDKGEQIIECLKFYGVASIAAWNKQMENYQVAFKSSDQLTQDKVAIQTWLKQGEIAASKIECQPFDKSKLKSSLPTLRELTNLSEPADFLPKLQSLCASCGVVVVFVPTPEKCSMSGAAKWLTKDKALLLLSLRYKNDDHLWFAFFHEIGHILKHRKQLFLENNNKKDFKGDEKLEAEADKFASKLLIPKQHNAELTTLKNQEAINKFAKKINIASGIVVGKLQHKKIINRSCCNHLKVKYQWKWH